MNRRTVETQFEMRTGGAVPFGAWLAQRHAAGVSLRRLADAVEEQTGVRVSHEAVRLWLKEG
ncbi:MAG TPA: hypothetical protein VIG24_05420 [Acidimicrobiia bacterium]